VLALCALAEPLALAEPTSKTSPPNLTIGQA
jgi:hypothetical protein